MQYPGSMFSDIERYVAYRTYDRYNKIEIPSLSPNYYDKDTILTHGLFDLLSDYVEVELGSRQVEHEKYRFKEAKHLKLMQLSPTIAALYNFFTNTQILPWFIRRHYPLPSRAHLRYAALRYIGETTHELSNSLPTWEGATKKDILNHKKGNDSHIKFLLEVKDIYLWYNDNYLKREDSYDVSGLSAVYQRMNSEGKSTHRFVPIENSTCLEMVFGGTDEDKKEYDAAVKRSIAIDEARRKETEKMLIRLIKIREGLWT